MPVEKGTCPIPAEDVLTEVCSQLSDVFWHGEGPPVGIQVDRITQGVHVRDANQPVKVAQAVNEVRRSSR